MRKQLIAAALCGLFITGLAGCANQPKPPAESVSDSTVTADDTSGIEMSDSIPAAPTELTESEASAESTASEPQQPAEKETAEAEPASQQTKPPVQTEAQKSAESTEPLQPKESTAVQTQTAAQPEQEPVPTEPDDLTEPVQQEPEPTPEETKPKTAYDYEFDIEAIKADCIGIGQGMGLALDSSLTPDNASWWNPVTASSGNQGEALKQSLASYITFHTAENLSAYGIDEITSFNIYCEARENGAYAIYFLFA